MKILLISLLMSYASIAQQVPPRQPITVDGLGIEVIGNSREVAYTNKNAGVFSTESGAEHRSGWQGWRVFSKEMLEDYRIAISGRTLRRSEVRRSVVYPHQLKRYYENGIEETITLLDSINALVIEVDNVQIPDIAIYPLFSDAASEDDFDMGFNRDILTIVRKNHPVRTAQANYPAAVSLSWVRENLWTGGFYDSTSFGRNFSPAYTKTVNPVTKHYAVFTVGDLAFEAISLMKFVAKNVDSLLRVRKTRMERLLNASYIHTDNPRFDKAVQWAKISMDDLIMNQTRKGIFAGLPWFDNYWGRDTYISLPGATLVTGDFADAREILKTFAGAQDTNPSHVSFGRVPNQITTTSTSYNTADGTPWFTIALGEYFDYSNDKSLVDELFPAVKRGIEGTLKYHTDAALFLTHGDAETWMDAAGPEGSWSPRGNRANDIQGLWFRQLETGARLASIAGDNASAAKWRIASTQLRGNYLKVFIDKSSHLAADHIRENGWAVREMRPNQMFTEEMLGDTSLIRSMFSAVTQTIVYPHGVASLSQDDDNFHPYHHYTPYYVQDAAYHNGVVWTWLSGKWIDLATRFGLSDLAFSVTSNMVDQLLDRGAVGTLSELSDAAPRPGEQIPRLSGAFSQAWSLAEFIRTAYQDYLGIRVASENGKPLLILSPNLPNGIRQADATIRAGDRIIHLDFSASGSTVRIAAVPDSMAMEPVAYRVDFNRASNEADGLKGSLTEHATTVLTIENITITETVGGRKKNVTARWGVRTDSSMEKIHLATPNVKEGLKALNGPSYRLLTQKEIKIRVGGRVIYDVSDAENDDKGSGTYKYPSTALLRPGSLDVTHFTVSADDKNVHFTLQFRELSNPGWHPEYGFQLTYAAIAIDKDRSGQSTVGMNSHYTFGKNFRFENVIYVGGGIRVDDAKGKTLAVYSPVEGDESDPLGDDRTKTIEFAIPAEIIGAPASSWRFAVLIGAQDDHGGAGIGEFRSVEATAREWVGGGKKKAGDSNVYDVILPKR